MGMFLKGRKERIESAEEIHESQQSAASQRAQVDSLVNSLLISTSLFLLSSRASILFFRCDSKSILQSVGVVY